MKRMILLAAATALLVFAATAAAATLTFDGAATFHKPYVATFTSDGSGPVTVTALFTAPKAAWYDVELWNGTTVLCASEQYLAAGDQSLSCTGAAQAGDESATFLPVVNGKAIPVTLTVVGATG